MQLGSDGPRWPRGQKFTRSEAGRAADDTYRAAVAAARGAGRSALDAALSAWSGPLGILADDGVVLSQLREGQLGLPDLVGALEDAGIEAREVRAALGRLIAAGLVELLAPPSQAREALPPAPPPMRWR